MPLSPDSQVLILLCSHLGIPKDMDLAPLTLREWNPLARKIQASPLACPKGLLGLGVSGIQAQLEIDEVDAQRLSRLLARGEELEVEMNRLVSMGIQVTTRIDPDYPQRYRQRLKDSAPAVLFYAGEPVLMGQPGIAVVGSRHLDQAGQECANFVGNACGLSGLVLYSGGAKGVDTLSMNAALDSRGSAVGILADSLERTIREPHNRKALERGDLCLVTPYSSNAGFSVGAAMGRNKLIYCLADYAVVVASDAGKGGTWAGATEAIKAGWIPVFVLEHAGMAAGNPLLIEKGGRAFPHPFPEHYSKLAGWLQDHSHLEPTKPTQLDLF